MFTLLGSERLSNQKTWGSTNFGSHGPRHRAWIPCRLHQRRLKNKWFSNQPTDCTLKPQKIHQNLRFMWTAPKKHQNLHLFLGFLHIFMPFPGPQTSLGPPGPPAFAQGARRQALAFRGQGAVHPEAAGKQDLILGRNRSVGSHGFYCHPFTSLYMAVSCKCVLDVFLSKQNNPVGRATQPPRGGSKFPKAPNAHLWWSLTVWATWLEPHISLVSGSPSAFDAWYFMTGWWFVLLKHMKVKCQNIIPVKRMENNRYVMLCLKPPISHFFHDILKPFWQKCSVSKSHQQGPHWSIWNRCGSANWYPPVAVNGSKAKSISVHQNLTKTSWNFSNEGLPIGQPEPQASGSSLKYLTDLGCAHLLRSWACHFEPYQQSTVSNFSDSGCRAFAGARMSWVW